MKRGRDGDGDEYVVNTASFASARAQEILTLAQEIADRKHQRVMQGLPFHKQRRQMTFSAKRMPKRVKDAAARELTAFNITPKPFRHRAFRRRPRFLAANFGRRERPHEAWLATHVWHAKRFSAIRLFGLVLPLRPFDRATRAAAKSLLRQCVVIDASAHSALQLRGLSDKLRALAAQVSREMVRGAFLRGGRSGTALVHGTDGVLIAPVSFLWRSDGSSLLIWVHQSAIEELQQFLKQKISDEDVVITRRALARFDLMGPESFSVLRRVLRPLDGESRLARFLGPVEASFVPERIAFVSRVCDPRLTMTALVSPATKGVNAQTLMDFANAGETGKRGSCMWDDEQEPGPPRQNDLDTRRSRTPPANRGCEVLLMHMPQHEDATGFGNGPSCAGAGFSLVVPWSWAVPFWHALFQARARAIGLDDLLRLRHQELGQPVFPFDFPESAAGQQFCVENAKRLLDHQLLRPAAKRVNHLSIEPAFYPFLFPTIAPIHRGSIATSPSDKDVMIAVRISMIGRGKVRFNASLLRPLPNDDGRQHVTATLPTMDLKQLHELACKGKLALPQANRELVGYAFGGGVSIKRGKGYGVGVVSLRFWKANESGGAVTVMLRNPNSRDVFRARLKPCVK